MANVQPQTIGQKLDAELAKLKTGAATVETDVVSEFTKVKTWVATNWPHAVTWAGGAWIAIKSGVLHIL